MSRRLWLVVPAKSSIVLRHIGVTLGSVALALLVSLLAWPSYTSPFRQLRCCARCGRCWIHRELSCPVRVYHTHRRRDGALPVLALD
jgi:hypothetical protein